MGLREARWIRVQTRLVPWLITGAVGALLSFAPIALDRYSSLRADVGQFFANMFVVVIAFGWITISLALALLVVTARANRSWSSGDTPRRRRRGSAFICLVLVSVTLYAAVRLVGTYAGHVYGRTWQLVDEGRWEEAVSNLDRATARFPRGGVLHGDRAWVLDHLGRYPEALASARRAVELDPQIPIHRHLLAGLLDVSGPSLAAVHARVRDWPEEGVAAHRVGLARRLLLLERSAAARRLLEQSLREEPDLDDARIALAEADILEGLPLEAIARLAFPVERRQLRMLTTRAIANRCAGLAYQARCDLEDARAWTGGRRSTPGQRQLEAFIDMAAGSPSSFRDESGAMSFMSDARVNWELTLRLAAQCPPEAGAKVADGDAP